MKKTIARLAVLLALCFVLLPQSKANAGGASKKQLQVDAELTEWILDENENMLYAISKSGKSLLFINATTMQLEKKVKLPGGPTDFILEDGTLYIALDSIHQIAVVDVKTRTCTDTLLTDSDPYRIAKDGDVIFYAEVDQWCNVRQYDINTGTDKVFAGTYYQPDIEVDPERHILYIAESGLTGSDMVYYSTISGKKVSETNYDGGYGFRFPARSVMIDGDYVYYAGRDFHPDNATRFEGDYGKSSIILHAENGLVYTKSDIYDKETHLRLGSYAKEIELAEMSDTAVYLYTMSDDTISRYEKEGSKVTANTVMSLISGKAATQLPENVKSDKTLASYQVLEMKYALSDWILDEKNNTVYAISEEEKAVVFINATTLDLEQVIRLKSTPKHMYQQGDQLYLSMYDTSQIIIVDGKDRVQTKTLYLSNQPYSCVSDGKKVYYATKNSVYEYDLFTRKEQKLNLTYVSSPGLALNEADQVLYVATGSSSGQMYYYDTEKQVQIGVTASFYYPSRKLFFDGSKVYFAGRAFDKLQPKRICGIYDEEDEEDILLVKNGLVYTESYIFDADTFECIDYSEAGLYTLFDVYNSGKQLAYSEEEQMVECTDLENLMFVWIDADNDEDFDIFYVDKGSLLPEPKTPVKKNHEFLGWYRYDYETENLTVKWDFTKDKVMDDCFLVAKWKKIVQPPKEIKATARPSENSIVISWGKVSQAVGYEVYRATSKKGEFTLLSECSTNQYIDKDVRTGITYYYLVKTVDKEDGKKITSEASEVVEQSLSLAQPVLGIGELISSNTLHIEWWKTEGVDGYQLYRATSMDGDYELIKETLKISYQDAGLQANTVYYYKVRAYKKWENETVYSKFSNVMEARSEFHPLILGPKKIASSSISLTWEQASGATGYEVYRAAGYQQNYKRIGTTASLSYKDVTAESGVSYCYKVRAYQQQDGKKVYGEFSEEIEGKTKNGAMTAITATAKADGTVKLAWNKVDKMTEYIIYRSTSKNGTYTALTESKKLSCIDTWAKPGITYYYKVVGCRYVEGERVVTNDSNKVSAKAVLSVPGKFKATSKRKGKAYLSWGAVKNANGFELYYATSKNGTYKKVVTMDLVKERFYTQSYLKSGKTYYYKMRAYRVNSGKKVYSKYTKPISVKVK